MTSKLLENCAYLIDVLSEMTSRSSVEILRAAGVEYDRMKGEGLIVEHETPFGTLRVLRHSLHEESRED